VITGWLMKLVLGILVAGLVVFELGSPLVTRTQIDGVAHDMADSAAFELLERQNLERAREVAQKIADEEDVVLESFTVDHRGLRVTVLRKARSLVLKKWDQTKTWYDVRVTATASTANR
jgi:hypothetical protein